MTAQFSTSRMAQYWPSVHLLKTIPPESLHTQRVTPTFPRLVVHWEMESCIVQILSLECTTCENWCRISSGFYQITLTQRTVILTLALLLSFLPLEEISQGSLGTYKFWNKMSIKFVKILGKRLKKQNIEAEVTSYNAINYYFFSSISDKTFSKRIDSESLQYFCWNNIQNDLKN